MINSDEATDLLIRWGSWCRSNEDIGYPKENIIYKLIAGRSSHHGSCAEIIIQDDVAQCERVVCRMPHAMKRLVKTIYVYRVTQGETATRFHVSRSEIKRQIDAASNWLAGYLSSAE